MAPRRTSKKVSKEIKDIYSYDTVEIDRVLCPICRSILIEPVTLPCGHHFCYLCFNETVNNAALVCPLCRTRISSWLRAARKDNKVINVLLWDIIQNKFSENVENKRRGKDDILDDCLYVSSIKLSTPGEIHEEYKNELAKEMKEVIREREIEEKASKDFIEKLQIEEELVAKAEAENLKQDAEVARRLAEEEAETVRKSSHNFTAPGSSKKTSIKKGPLDSFVFIADIKKCPEFTAHSTPKSVRKPLVTCKLDFSKSQISVKEMVSSKNDVTVNKSNHKSPVLHHSFSEKKDKSFKPKVLFSSELTQNDKEKVLLDECVQNINESLKNETEDIIKKEISHFKPITMIPRTPPKRDRHGRAIESPIIRSKAVKIIDNTVQYYRVKSPYQKLISSEKDVHQSAFKLNLNFDSQDSEYPNEKLNFSDNFEINENHTKSKIDIKNCQFMKNENENKETDKNSQNISSLNHHPRLLHKCVNNNSNDIEFSDNSCPGSPFYGFANETTNKYDSYVSILNCFNENIHKMDASINSGLKCFNNTIIDNEINQIKDENNLNEIAHKKMVKDVSSNADFEESIIFQQRLLEQAILQEQKDFELACKLQEEFDRDEPRTYTLRNGEKRTPMKKNTLNSILISQRSKSKKRQSTMDEICGRKKYKV